ncbi:MAG: FUSC family protein [Tissierella sp.]|uniref:FUSC family protein n=1 Tax=Tissierella sp. TaxID=41274 RepID=UPI003F9858FE
MKVKKIGMRTIKTVIAVVLTLEIAKLLDINSPILAGIAAIMTMETSVSESFRTGKFRMFGTVLGAIIALIITSISPVNFITTALGLIVIIYSSNVLKWQKAVKMAMIVFLVIIVDFEGGDGFTYALNRTIDTFIGVIVGTTINYFIRPPKIDIKIYNIIENTTKEIVKDIKKLVWGDGNLQLDNLKKKIDYIEENYQTLKRDLKLKKNTNYKSIDYEHIFELFQNIYSHLRIIKLINKKIPINESNKELLKENFVKMKDIPEIEFNEKEELYIIYNFHLRRIIYDLQDVKDLYEEKEELK